MRYRQMVVRGALLIIALVLTGGVCAPIARAARFWQPDFAYTTVLNDATLQNPTAIEVAPDGKIYVAERNGNISIVESPGGERRQLKSIAVDGAGERGLLNIALDNDFANHAYLYAYYTGVDAKIHIGRMPVTTSGLGELTDIYVGSEEFNQFHNGGGLDTDMQGHVYFSTGENYKPQLAQDVTVENGKLLRVNRDGTVPSDNPYLSQAGALPELYAVGLRNPFRLTVDKATGAVYVGDVGSEYAEEINHMLPGKNYGWPNQEGDRCSDPCQYQKPIYHYNRDTTGKTIILGPVYRGTEYPQRFQGKLFFGDWMVGLMDMIDTEAPHTLANFSTGNGNIIDFDLGADGKLYFIEHYSHKITRVDYTGQEAGNTPPVAQPTCTPIEGLVPLEISCKANATDADGDPLSYTWNFEQDAESSLAAPTYVYNTPGIKTVSLTVSDGESSITAAPVRVQVGQPPTVRVTQPSGDRLYKGGDTLNYQIEAADANGSAIADDKVSVKIDLHHNEHHHDFMPATPGKNGSVQIPIHGETEPTIFYRMHATATDSQGLKTTTTHDIQLVKSKLTLATDPGIGKLQLDGVEHASGAQIEGVAGLERTIEAPKTLTDSSGKLYAFKEWSDGGSRSHAIRFPDTATTLTARYEPQMGNIIKNPSLDTYSEVQRKPDFWRLSRWDGMQSTFDFKNIGRDGSGGCRITATDSPPVSSSFCHPSPMNIQAGREYSFSNHYKSNTFSAVFALFTNDDGMYQFHMLGASSPASEWKEQQFSVRAPAGATRMTVFQSIHSNGVLSTDDYLLKLK